MKAQNSLTPADLRGLSMLHLTSSTPVPLVAWSTCPAYRLPLTSTHMPPTNRMIKRKLQLHMVMHACNPALRRLRQEDYEFETTQQVLCQPGIHSINLFKKKKNTKQTSNSNSNSHHQKNPRRVLPSKDRNTNALLRTFLESAISFQVLRDILTF